MVYLDIYDTVFEYLEEIGIVDKVVDHYQKIFRKLSLTSKNQETLYDLIAEFALFNYYHEKMVLIDFLEQNLYPSLEGTDTLEFEQLRASKRYNVLFRKKEKMGKKDTKNLDLYEVHFEDQDNKVARIVVSSSPLENNKNVVNIRLISHHRYPGKYVIVGGIFEERTYQDIQELDRMEAALDSVVESAHHVERILLFSKEHTLAEIDSYDSDGETGWIESDKKLIKMNRLFFERFSIGFDDFLNRFFSLSNDKEKFVEMTEHYISIVEKIEGALLDADYELPVAFMPQSELIEAYAAFIKRDRSLLEKTLRNVEKAARQNYENQLKREHSFSREGIMAQQIVFLEKWVAPRNIGGYAAVMERLKQYGPDDHRAFLMDVKTLLEETQKNLEEEESIIQVTIRLIEQLIEHADELPYQRDIVAAHEHELFLPEELHMFFAEEERSLVSFLQAVSLLLRKQHNEAYQLLKRQKIEKTESFEEMFLIGKVFSFYEDAAYKGYFKKAKTIDKQRYRHELDRFLKEKTGATQATLATLMLF